jgi:23S rRNA (cytosine1962-C5)-methyltransferase
MTRRAPGARRKHGDVLTLALRKPLERSLRSGHPWLYRDALEPFEAAPGTPVRVLDRSGRFLAAGLADAGPIGVRVFSLRDEAISAALFASRVARAMALRARCLPPETDAYRLLHGEGDFLPGFVCDRYGECAVLKLDGDAAPVRRDDVVAALVPELQTLGVRSLLLRSGQRQEHTTELIWGPAPPQELVVREHGMRLCANLYQGQKTGLFLDHRETRRRVRQLAQGASVLNLYGYTGGFSIAAALGGARAVTTVDLAKPALALARRTFAANELGEYPHRVEAADALAYLEAGADGGERHQLVVCDPPNFAPKKSVLDKALATYEALHSAALRVLDEGGIYVAASCSSHVDRAAFEESIRRGAAHRRRSVQVLERSSAPADHPRLLAFPEGDYLKIVIARVF